MTYTLQIRRPEPSPPDGGDKIKGNPLFWDQVGKYESSPSANRQKVAEMIRQTIAQGRMEEAEECLGYPYFIRARIGYGEHVGTAIGIPTANQRVPDGKLCPPYGVYVSLLETEGRMMPAITNIGVKPTAGPGFHLGLETHVLDGGRELYGQMAETRLLHFLRPERKFSTMQELKEEVERNIAAAREFFAESREKQNHPE